MLDRGKSHGCAALSTKSIINSSHRRSISPRAGARANELFADARVCPRHALPYRGNLQPSPRINTPQAATSHRKIYERPARRPTSRKISTPWPPLSDSLATMLIFAGNNETRKWRDSFGRGLPRIHCGYGG